MRRHLRAASAVLAAALAALALTGDASAKSFSLPAADVSVHVAKDGSLVVDELITYAFSGPFSGGYRDIPLREGESIDGVQVSENGRAYRPGGCTELGCADAPGTFGTTDGRRARAHRLALPGARRGSGRSRIRYRLSGVAVAYDDVVDVNLKVWGSEWKEPLGPADRDRDGARARSSAPGAIRSTSAATSQLAGDEGASCARWTSRPGSSSSCAR